MSAVGSLQAPGCIVCALPTKVLATLHRDHAQGLLSARGLALRYETADAPLTTAAVRRHLKTHVPPPAVAGASGDSDSERPGGVGDYAAFIEGAVDAEGVLVATIRRTLCDLATMEGEVASARSAGNGAEAIRAMAVVLRTKHLLVRELKAYTGSTGRTEPPADLATVATVFDELLDKPIDDQVLLEVTTRALLQKLRAVEAGYLAAANRNPEVAERAWSIFLKTHTALEGTLQRLHHLRQDGNGDTNLASAPEADGGHVEALPTAFDGLLEGQVSAQAVSQAVVRAIADKMKRVEQDYQTAVLAGRGDADQALTKFLKMLPLLQRALERFQETGKPQEEMKKSLESARKELTEVAFAAVDKFMNAHVDTLHKLVDQFAQGKLILKLLQRYLDDYRTQWRQSLGSDLWLDLTAAYQKSKLWRELRNYPQQPLDAETNARCASHGPSGTKEVAEGVLPEQSIGGPIVSDREESTAENEPRPVASAPDPRSYTAAELVDAIRRGEIEPMEALRALRECAPSYSMDDLSRIMIEARLLPEVKQEAIRLLAERDEQKRPP